MAKKYIRVAHQTIPKNSSNPSDHVWKQIVKFLIRFNKFDFALEILQNISQDTLWKDFFSAKILHSQGKYHDSYLKLKTLLNGEEGKLAEEALILSSKNLYFLFKNFEAEENLLQYVKKKSNSINSHNMVFLGLIFMQRKNYSCSEKILTKIIKKTQKSALLWYLLGLCLLENNKWKKAEEAFIKAREIDPEFSDTILGLFYVRINNLLKQENQFMSQKLDKGISLLKNFFQSMDKYEIMNLKMLEDVSRTLEEHNMNDLALKCLFRISKDFFKYKDQTINQLVNIFKIEKSILRKI
jgi:tetratricopeptide (TPR) repeat protein